MSNFKLLIDTNILIGLEDAQPVQASLAELVRLSSEHGVTLYVDAANYEDVERDRDATRRKITLSKLAKFPRLRGTPISDSPEAHARFGTIRNENDRSDVRFLMAVDAKAVDFLVTQDIGLHRRAENAGLGSNILTIEEALEWLKQAFSAKSISLPYVVERKAYELSVSHPIFTGLRADYHPHFDAWFDKCRREHRDCWTLEVSGEIAGLVIRKDETRAEAGTIAPGSRVLKICTFKVREDFQGEKFGELLLKQILWFAHHNRYDTTYLTAFPKQAFLINLLQYYGFQQTKRLQNSELVLEKQLIHGELTQPSEDTFSFDRKNYPRFYDGATVRKFCIPIRPDYHRRLFPEIAFAAALPLFPEPSFIPIASRGETRVPGNTIRKVYLCRSKTTRIRPGDIVWFYMSKDATFAASQSITTIGVVEQCVNVSTVEQLITGTAKRSVFSAEELTLMRPSTSSPIKMIDFLLIGHTNPPITLQTLVSDKIFLNRPPQSISEFSDEQYRRIKAYAQIGFQI